MPSRQELVKIGFMQWQNLSTVHPCPDAQRYAPEVLLLSQALAAKLAVVPCWIAVPQGTETAPWEALPGTDPWLLRAPFQGGESLQRRPEALAARTLNTTVLEHSHLLQVLPASILQEGWLLLDPDYNQDACLIYEQTETRQILAQLPSWQTDSAAAELSARLQHLSAQVRAALSWCKLRLYWLNTPEQLWLLMISPEERWPELGPGWRDFSVRESLPAHPEPLLRTLLEDLGEEICSLWCKELAPEQGPQPGQFAPALLGHGGRLWYHQSTVDRLRQAVARLSLRREIQLCHRHLQRLKQEQTWFLEGFNIPHAGLAGFCQQMANLYVPLLGYSLLSELLLQRAFTRLEQWGVFPALQQTHLNPLSRLLPELTALREQAQRLLLDKPSLRATDLPQQAVFRQPWQVFLSQFGHRGCEELSLRSPRLSEEPIAVLNMLLRPWQTSPSRVPRGWKMLLLRPYWRWVCALLDAQTQFRSDALWALYQMKKQLQSRLVACVSAGQLRQPDDFWFLTLEEVHWLDQGAAIPAAFLQQRRQQWQSRQEPWIALSAPSEQRLQGQALLQPEREGWIWHPASAEESLPEAMKPWQTILVLKSLDPGHYPQLMQAAAVILGQDHDLNGGLSVLREWGIPALFGLGAQIAHLRTGQYVRLNGQTVQLLSEPLDQS